MAKIGADLASPAGFALRTGKPVISNNLENEGRFWTPELLLRHGIRRAMNVILEGDGKPFGVLEVDSRNDDKFVQQDLAFLQSAANILGLAIERERREQNLKAALERQEMLLHEVSHRVKNSLAIVASMLKLQSTSVGDAMLARHLETRPVVSPRSRLLTSAFIGTTEATASISVPISKASARTSTLPYSIAISGSMPTPGSIFRPTALSQSRSSPMS